LLRWPVGGGKPKPGPSRLKHIRPFPRQDPGCAAARCPTCRKSATMCIRVARMSQLEARCFQGSALQMFSAGLRSRPCERLNHPSWHPPICTGSNSSSIWRPCRLIAKHLILHSWNVAGRVDTGLEIIELWPAFQSEKTGSTPVGSAMNPLRNLVGCRPFATHQARRLPLGVHLLFSSFTIAAFASFR